MASEVGICNLALIQIGNTKFISTLDDESDEAQVCRLCYEQNRDETLQAFAWHFASRRLKPAPLVATALTLGAVPTGWTYAFAMPDDCVTKGLTRIVAGARNPRVDEEIPFAVEYDARTGTLIILCDLKEPEFIYTARITDPNLFPADFIRALAWNLSEDLVLGLRKDPKIGIVARQAYAAALATARSSALTYKARDLQPVPAHIAKR